MTAVVEQAPGAAPRAAYVGKVTQARVIKSEWIKFRSLRSSYWTLVVASGAMIALALLWGLVIHSKYPGMLPMRRAEVRQGVVTDPLRGVYIGQLAVGVLGVMIITGEYSTGMIRASLAAAPRRLPVLWAKALVFSVIVWFVTTATTFVCFLLSQSLVSSLNIQASLSTPGVLRVLFGAGLYLTVVGLLGIGLGVLIRSTAGAIASLFGIMLVLPVIGHLLDLTSWGDKINPYLPSNAGGQIMAMTTQSPDLSPWKGFALFVGYAAAAIVAAAILLKKRDA